MGKNINVFVATSSYHILMSCTQVHEGDYLIKIGNEAEDYIIENLIATFFSHKVKKVKSLYQYRDSLFLIHKYKKELRNAIRDISRCCEITDITVFNDVDPVAQWILRHIRYNGRAIIFEEGIGLYRDVAIRHKMLFTIFAKILFGLRYDTIIHMGESRYVDTIKCFNPKMLSDKQKKKVIIQLNNIDYMDLKQKVHIENNHYRIWFVGQPLVEDGVMDAIEYGEVIGKVIRFAEQMGISIAIKPHPREDKNKLQSICEGRADIIDRNIIPVELLVNNEKEVLIFTIYSSAVMGLSRLSNVKTYALYKMTSVKQKLTSDIGQLFAMCNVEVIESQTNLSGVKL